MSHLSSVCVFCGASQGADPAYGAAADALGRILAESGIRLVFGGGHVGLMGRVADAALAAGGEVIGVIPAHLMQRELGHEGVSEMLVTGSMHERKEKMFSLADGFVVLPGGIGTLDETFEIITWKQLSMHDKPVVILDVAGYWAPFQALIGHIVGAGFAGAATALLFEAVTRPEDVLAALQAQPASRLRADTARL